MSYIRLESSDDILHDRHSLARCSRRFRCRRSNLRGRWSSSALHRRRTASCCKLQRRDDRTYRIFWGNRRWAVLVLNDSKSLIKYRLIFREFGSSYEAVHVQSSRPGWADRICSRFSWKDRKRVHPRRATLRPHHRCRRSTDRTGLRAWIGHREPGIQTGL